MKMPWLLHCNNFGNLKWETPVLQLYGIVTGIWKCIKNALPYLFLAVQLSRHADIVQPQPVKNYSRTLLMFKIMKVSECYTFILCVQEFQTIIGKIMAKNN